MIEHDFLKSDVMTFGDMMVWYEPQSGSRSYLNER